jgi:hypothetical protein
LNSATGIALVVSEVAPRLITISLWSSAATANEPRNAAIKPRSHPKVLTTAAITSTVSVVVVRRANKLRQWYFKETGI